MSIFFYNIFLLLYEVGISISSLWNKKAAQWKKGRENIFAQIQSKIQTSNNRVIWMHCSSLGEFEQGKPVVEKLKSQTPNSKLLITFFSPSGYEVNKNYPGVDYLFYLPMDSKKNAKKFLNIVNPALVLWVKYDYWYYYLTEIRKRGIDSLLVSAVFRKQQPFFRWYGSLQRKMIRSFTRIFVQNEESRQLLNTLGIENTTISGDTRFDRVIEIAEKFESIPFIENFIGDSKCIVAGSTWKDDEVMLQKLLASINDHNLKLVIAPHDVELKRLDELKSFFPASEKFSDITKNPTPGTNILIIDNIGMLSRLYKYGYINYVGGGFTKDGVHNILEAAVYGKPVIFGPNYKKYREAIELIDAGGANTVSTANELFQAVDSLMNDKRLCNQKNEASKNYVDKNKGATDKILQFIYEKRLLTS